MDELKIRQDLYSGFGDTFARAFEFVVTPALFGVGGWFLDRALGLTPLFTILLTVLCLVGVGAKMYYGYVAAMEAQEKNAPWAGRQGRTTGAASPSPASPEKQLPT